MYKIYEQLVILHIHDQQINYEKKFTLFLW